MSAIIIRRLGPEAWKIQHRAPGGRVVTLHGERDQPTEERARRVLGLAPDSEVPTVSGRRRRLSSREQGPSAATRREREGGGR